MRLRDAATHLLCEIYCGFNRHEPIAVRPPHFVEAAAWDMLHGEVAAGSLFCLDDVCVEYANDVRVPDFGEEDRFSERALDLVQVHAHSFEDFHGLSAKEPVFYSVHLRESPLAQEALHLIGVSYGFAFT